MKEETTSPASFSPDSEKEDIDIGASVAADDDDDVEPQKIEEEIEVEENDHAEIVSSAASATATAPVVNRTALFSYRQHTLDVFSITSPIIASEIFQNTLPVVDIAFIGRALSKEDLAAAALATVWFNLWNSTMMGYMTAIDTLLSQSFGAGKHKAFATWTGSCLVVIAITTILVAALSALCGPAMKLFGQDEALANEAAYFSYRLIPGLFPYYIFKVLVKYLQTQDILWPGVFVGLFANGFNILFNWLLIYEFDMGIAGAPWATTLTRFVELFMIVAYLYWNKAWIQNTNNNGNSSTWPILDRHHVTSREHLRPFWNLAISGALSMTAEAWSFEITTILAGLLGTVALDAHIITLTIATFIFLSFPFAIGIAASIRVGQLIGDGQSGDAKRSSKVSLILAALVQAVLVAILWPMSDVLGHLFSSDDEVAELVSHLIPISCLFMMGDAVQGVSGGALRGLGRQRLVLWLNILGFWMLAVPIGSTLTFAPGIDLGVPGLWWGFVIGIYASACISLYILRFRVDWGKEANKATKRLSTFSSFVVEGEGETSTTIVVGTEEPVASPPSVVVDEKNTS